MHQRHRGQRGQHGRRRHLRIVLRRVREVWLCPDRLHESHDQLRGALLCAQVGEKSIRHAREQICGWLAHVVHRQDRMPGDEANVCGQQLSSERQALLLVRRSVGQDRIFPEQRREFFERPPFFSRRDGQYHEGGVPNRLA